MSIENENFGLSRGPSEAAKQSAIEAIHMATMEYRKAEEEVLRLNATPESNERDEALTVQYGKKRLAEDRLKAMGVENPPETIQ